MFTVLESDEVVGFSAWPWDRLYTPVVGCFVSGALVATATCDQEPMQVGRAPSMAFHARARRRLMRELGRPIRLGPPPLNGPGARVWFRMTVPVAAAERLRAHDPAVRVERLEDGALVAHHAAQALSPSTSSTVVPIEALLDAPEAAADHPLDGFAAFLTSPPLHQLEVAFFEYLRRLPEQEARRGYLPRMESGEITVLNLRAFILASDEFKARRVGYGARLGASLTSHAWTRLASLPSLVAGHRPLAPFRLGDYVDRSTPEFVEAAYQVMLGRPSDPGGLAHYVHVSDTEGRKVAALELNRGAASRGVYLEIVD